MHAQEKSPDLSHWKKDQNKIFLPSEVFEWYF